MHVCRHMCVYVYPQVCVKTQQRQQDRGGGDGEGHPGPPPCPHPMDLAVWKEVFSFSYGFRITFCSVAGKSVQRKMNYEHLGMSP